jgi:hypothetical protein
MIRYDVLAVLVIIFLWAALPGGVSHGEIRVPEVIPPSEPPVVANVVDGRIIHVTHRSPTDVPFGQTRTLSDAVGSFFADSPFARPSESFAN